MHSLAASKPSPEEAVPEHSSRWIRLVIRTLSIRGIPWVLFALSIFATAIVCQQAFQSQKKRRQADFEADAEILCTAMLERLKRYEQLLQGTGGLFAASEEVEQWEFRSYADALDLPNRYPGLRALGYVEMVDHSRLSEFHLSAARDADDLGQPLRIWPAGDRPDYLVVRFVEPIDDNRRAFGFDVGSESVRRDAAMEARDLAAARLTGKLELVQAPGEPAAVLFQPVYAGVSSPETTAGRQARLSGWVYAAFLVGDMMEGVEQATQSPLAYQVFDDKTPNPENLLCSSSPQLAATLSDDLRQNSTVDAFGQPWTLQFRVPADHSRDAGILPVALLASGGFCMSLLIFGVAHSMATTGRRAVSIATDMTAELRRQRKALQASEERLAMVIEGSNDGIWDWDLITDEVYFSPRWKSMLGYRDHEIENVFSAWVALLHPDDRERVLGLVNSYIAGDTPSYQLEHRLRHKDGGYRWILARGVATRDAEGKPVRMAGSHVDLTELKQVEQDLRQTNQELEQTQLELIQAAKLESVGSLAAGVAHEVKNPLQIIVMGLDYLDHRFDSGDEDSRITLADMRDAALRADSITKELLNLSAATKFTPVRDNLEAVVERSLWLLATNLTRAKVTVVRRLADNLPPVSIDRQKIQQVLINIIHNAIQAMGDSGTLTVTTTCDRLEKCIPMHGGLTSPLQADDQVVMLSLRDSGPGIPADLLARIFDPFFTTKDVGSGTGLGLSVVRKIMDLHGGVIDVRNAPGGGLEVKLAFATAPHAADIPCPAPPAAASSRSTPTTTDHGTANHEESQRDQPPPAEDSDH